MARLQSETTVTVRGRIIGGAKPLVCVPVLAVETSALLDQAMAVVPTAPDLVEWRADAYGALENTPACLHSLERLRSIIGDIPLIVTCRAAQEGGMQAVPLQSRLTFMQAAMQSGLPDLIDIELGNPHDFIAAIQATAARCGVRQILSYHDFAGTPGQAVIVDKLMQAQAWGADIAKVAVMPNSYQDVLTLLGAVYHARSGGLKIPMAAMSMGGRGVITRIAGALFGSDVTFAAGFAPSAPGQIPIADLRLAMALLQAE